MDRASSAAAWLKTPGSAAMPAMLARDVDAWSAGGHAGAARRAWPNASRRCPDGYSWARPGGLPGMPGLPGMGLGAEGSAGHAGPDAGDAARRRSAAGRQRHRPRTDGARDAGDEPAALAAGDAGGDGRDGRVSASCRRRCSPSSRNAWCCLPTAGARARHGHGVCSSRCCRSRARRASSCMRWRRTSRTSSWLHWCPR